jgi:hypothetical protein
VVLEKLFEQRSGRILMTDDVVEGLNNAFVMVSETMTVGVRWRHPEAPTFVHLRVLTGEDGFPDRCRDPGWGMREEEGSWELTIACAGLSGPVREVVTIRPGDEVGVEFRRDELSVHCLVLVFFFVAKLQFDLSGLSFSLSGFSFCTHQVIWGSRARKGERVLKTNRRQSPRTPVGSCENSYFRKRTVAVFAADIADDEQNIETRDVETVKLAEHDETRHLW